ncbi:hypothetical protein [uncultured Mesotoga sp.]|uniref:hypothetical protein n=1 Tax=uncultured Mesotoga sp. TaxID=1184400 RepID=UPI002591AC70|nr:hypothetical protein [uncultured Mesotoga sp.]
MKGADAKAISAVEVDLQIIKKNLDRLNKRLKPDNAQNMLAEISFTLSTSSQILTDAIDSLSRLANQIDR